MTIKFLTLNLWRGGMLFDNIVQFVHKENPDIITFQEVYNGENTSLEKRFRAYTVLKDELDFTHTNFAPTFSQKINGDIIDQGNAIFSKFPIIFFEKTFFDVPYGLYEDTPGNYEACPRNIQHVTVDLSEKKLDVFNVHGIWGTHGEDTERRLHMSEVIVGQINGKENAIMAGDFNLQPTTQTIKNIEKYMTNIFDSELSSTFNMVHKDNPGYASAVVDIMFATPNITVEKHYMPMDDVSDHRPLVSMLEI